MSWADDEGISAYSAWDLPDKITMYSEKQVGQPCPDCGTPYTEGKKGAYCKPCYVKWAEAKKGQGVSNMGNIPIDQFLTITQFNETLDKMRSAFSLMDKRIKALELIVGAEMGEPENKPNAIGIVDVKDDEWASGANKTLGIK